MRKSSIEANKKCPACSKIDKQEKNGLNRSGTQSYLCGHYKKSYTLEPKRHVYSEETKALALKIYYACASGRGVGKILGMSKANVYRWIKNEMNVAKWQGFLELDELYWFIGQKSHRETRENVYLITMVCRKPHQIVVFV